MIEKTVSQPIFSASRQMEKNPIINKASIEESIIAEDAFTKSEADSDHVANEKKLHDIIQGMNKFMQPSHTSVKFQLHEKLNEYYVTIVDDVTDEVVKEIPSKKFLDMYAAMTEFVGLVVDKKA
ncbi:flagellar protein FlaG [Niallia sp. 01092]|uniref:flagellar protein FlaG n=1 Tax=unclassified Niallia TaxID=2837522 RepID=UPI003FD144FE